MHEVANRFIDRKIRNIVVIGIGGSFLGAKAAIEMCGKHNKMKFH
jgi:glucose-6-phosphate isomerase